MAEQSFIELQREIQNRINSELEKIITIKEDNDNSDITGRVERFADGIGRISGLNYAKFGQKLLFPISSKRAKEDSPDNLDIFGLVMDIESDSIECIVFGEERFIKEGDIVELDASQETLSIPINDDIIGKVVDPFCREIKIVDDNFVVEKSNLDDKIKHYPIEKDAPPISSRAEINKPFHTGIKIIDTSLPIGLGQRMLVIGDRGTGKTTLALTLIKNVINQENPNNVIYIYTAIGKKVSEIKAIFEKFSDISNKFVILLTKANDPASLVYIAPFAATTIAEYFRDKGKDVVIIYDDLTAHAKAYRHVSLLLERPPGREAFPGDIFYLHSRLLERSSNVYIDTNKNSISTLKKYKECTSNGNNNIKTASITAIPIVQTSDSDFSAYIPTNIISITDGQIYLDTDLANNKILPAINIGLSVSRIGSKAQNKIVAILSRTIKAEIAQFKEKQKYLTYGFDLSESDKVIINHGNNLINFSIQKELEVISEKELIKELASINFYRFFGLKKIENQDSQLSLDSATSEYLDNLTKSLNNNDYKIAGFEDKHNFEQELSNSIREFINKSNN